MPTPQCSVKLTAVFAMSCTLCRKLYAITGL